jgi:hypothetical protein
MFWLQFHWSIIRTTIIQFYLIRTPAINAAPLQHYSFFPLLRLPLLLESRIHNQTLASSGITLGTWPPFYIT